MQFADGGHLNGRDPRACYLLGPVQLGLYMYDDARAAFTTFLEPAPNRLVAWRDDASYRRSVLK